MISKYRNPSFGNNKELNYSKYPSPRATTDRPFIMTARSAGESEGYDDILNN